VADPRRFAAALLVVAGIAACDAGPASPPSGSAPMVVRAGTAGPTSPAAAVAPNGLDLLFAKMMLGHHAQAVSMSGRENGLPISSSPLSTSRSAGVGAPAARSAATAHTTCTSPAFMSNTPGPVRRSPSTTTGQPVSVPALQTVS